MSAWRRWRPPLAEESPVPFGTAHGRLRGQWRGGNGVTSKCCTSNEFSPWCASRGNGVTSKCCTSNEFSPWCASQLGRCVSSSQASVPRGFRHGMSEVRRLIPGSKCRVASRGVRWIEVRRQRDPECEAFFRRVAQEMSKIQRGTHCPYGVPSSFRNSSRTMNQDGTALSQRDRAHLGWQWAQ
jgi:hypothetical protein